MSSEAKKLNQIIKEADELFRHVRDRKKSKDPYKEALKIATEEKKEENIQYINGKLALIDENYKKALKYLENATKINKNYLDAWHYKGLVYDKLGDLKKAERCYQFVLGKDKNYFWSWNNLGVIYDQILEFEKAAECYDQVIKGSSDKNLVATACYNKGHDYYDWGEYSNDDKHYKNALIWFDKALKNDPEYFHAHNRKGLTYHRLKDYDKAVKCYDAALKICPEYEISQINKQHTKTIKKINDKISQLKKNKELSEDARNEEIIKLQTKKLIIIKLIDKYDSILDTKNTNERKFADLLKPREEPLNENFLMILRRWNSYTPALITDQQSTCSNGIEGSNLGGGYFLYWKGKGIVIDPGFDFLDNFFYKGYKVDDIDAVIITHAHIDHYIDFEPLFTLIYEYNDNINKKIKKLEKMKIQKGVKEKIINLKREKKKIDIFMNLGVLKKMLGWIPIHEDDDSLINRVYPLEKDVSYEINNYNMKITAKAAIHNEILSKEYAVGLKFTLYDQNTDVLRIGFTSDTKHNENIENQYKNLDIIIPHLGSIEDNIFDIKKSDNDSGHLMLKGIIPIIYKSEAKLAIISEFGEELGKHRLTIVDALNEAFYKDCRRTKCITGDIGLKVSLPELNIKCDICSENYGFDSYSDYDRIHEKINPTPTNNFENGILYFCDDCKDY